MGQVACREGNEKERRMNGLSLRREGVEKRKKGGKFEKETPHHTPGRHQKGSPKGESGKHTAKYRGGLKQPQQPQKINPPHQPSPRRQQTGQQGGGRQVLEHSLSHTHTYTSTRERETHTQTHTVQTHNHAQRDTARGKERKRKKKHSYTQREFLLREKKKEIER